MTSSYNYFAKTNKTQDIDFYLWAKWELIVE